MKKTSFMRNIAFYSVASTVMLSAMHAQAQDMDIDPNDLLNLSLEQLSNVEVTSVSKKREKVSEAAAAIFVISQEDIVRSGMTSIPEVLRMVPGLSVAQSGSHSWAISSRGFTGQFANKLLVLIDGRTVYTPLFSGVYWDVQDTPLRDIERIEVIRGPGATLWGANAVNGVINIITKSAKDTQGTMLSQSVGNIDSSLTSVRHGSKIGENTYARLYAKYDDRDEFRTTTDRGAQDNWNKVQGGFRVDGKDVGGMSFTLQGDVYKAGESYPSTKPTLVSPFSVAGLEREEARGGNVLARINNKVDADSSWSLQMYFDNQQRVNSQSEDNRNTVDIEFQHNYQPIENHAFVWGAGYRLVTDRISGTLLANFTPVNRTYGLFNFFLQDDITLNDQVKLTVGSKLEHNDFTGFQLQPSARMAYLVDEKQTLWASASHAVRTPNRFSDDGSLALTATSLGGGNFAYLQSTGNRDLDSERLNAFEAGYRIQAQTNLSFDVTTFYNHYLDVVTNQVGNPVSTSFNGGTPYFIVPVTPINGNGAQSYGLELAVQWEPTPNWTLNGSYSYLDFKRKKADALGFTVANNSPPHQASIRSTVKLPYDLEMSNAVYYVDQLKNQDVDSYIRFDTRIAWHVLPSVELSIVGQNLFDDSHPEYGAFIYQNTAEVPRSIYGNVTWTF